MIAPEGWVFVWVPLCLGVVVLIIGWPWLGWLLIAFGVFALFFFRNPDRQCDHGSEVACSPADGKVIVVGSGPSDLADRGLPQQISVFMSVFSTRGWLLACASWQFRHWRSLVTAACWVTAVSTVCRMSS